MPWSPPEVLSGQSNGNAVSDVYSLAATIWNLLVGRSPFSVPGDNSDRALFTRILHSKPPPTGRADVPIEETTAATLGRPAPRPSNSAFDCSKFAADTQAPLRPWRAALAAYLATVKARESAA